MGKDHTALWDDAHRRPDDYPDSVVEVLLKLMTGQATWEALTDAEKEELDKAVLHYAAPFKAKEPSSAPPPTVQTTESEQPVERPRPGVDVPETELPAFWWLG